MSDSDPAKRVERLRRAQPRRKRELDDRLPPGQFVTEKFPVLTYGPTPQVDLGSWQLTIDGAVERELTLSWEELISLPTVRNETDIHCVTRWSMLDTSWEGVAFRELAERVRPLPAARFVMQHSYGGYTTNLPLGELMGDDVLLAYRFGGEALEPEHGGPLRMVVPKLYFWKSAKWVNRLEFLTEDSLGFWETYGYHHHGDPWNEERFS
jgi:DMSO/TMAO reductase YedYZ molybdopterin-dependent catalytic subunit